jgi:hypothetical protein
MRSPAKFNGRPIALRGVLSEGGHGAYLRGESCDGVFRANGASWPSIVFFTVGQKEWDSRGLDFQRFSKAIQDMYTIIEARTRGLGSDVKLKVTVTFVGILETRHSFDGETNTPHPWEPGFGPGAAAPAQIFTDSVKDIVVESEIAPNRKR